MRRRPFVQWAALAAIAPRAGRAQAWPARALRWVVPFPPGGTTDEVTRLVARQLRPRLGQDVAIDHLPGRGTVTGVDDVAKSPADGYTFVTVANSFCVNETLMRRPPYRMNDLRPVALMAMSEHVLAATPASGLKNVADIVSQYESGKALAYASSGPGTSTHLAGEMLKSVLGTPGIVHVPYGGQAPALQALLAGKVTMMFGSWSQLRVPIADGQLNALGMASEKRSAFAPHLPTLGEQGAAVESNSWNGVLAPAGVSARVVERMNQEINAILRSEQMAAVFRERGLVPLAGSAERFSHFLSSEVRHYADVIYRVGMPFED
ncbi:MAG: tripartite tricarboxylate transporter substrate binding protein [Comamonas sp.]|nr:tripartite tricarboxylate transporter substrate binding protein [Comamonas sp.]